MRRLPSSFRDPSGFMFEADGVLYRQINQSYQDHYKKLMDSRLYAELTRQGLMIPHTETDKAPPAGEGYKVIRPECVPYVSYPHEWCFSQLKDAALCTLRVQQVALRHGMALKDASAYNIQFHRGRPLLIDTLSFEEYRDGAPWAAYRQFCQHFLGPLALMAHRDVRLSQLFRVYLDGPPLDLVSLLLPTRTWLKYSLLSHLHLHARSQARYAGPGQPAHRGFGEGRGAGSQAAEVRKPRPINRLAFTALMQSIENAVRGLNWKPPRTEWGDYYAATNYSDEGMRHKGEIIREFIAGLPKAPPLIQDLGANDGTFSRVAGETGIPVVSQDVDPVAVENNYRRVKENGETHILPLVLDLTNPGADMGWALRERDSFLARNYHGGLVMALALIHHLAISNNVPLADIAGFFAALGKTLIIEFVPKVDSQVQRLLASREDIFPDYHREGFERAFAEFFTIKKVVPIQGGTRVLYLMEKS